MEQQSFTLPSFAKVNLSLLVLGKREDNFHELWTVFQTVSLKDEITFTLDEKLTLTSNDKQIPLDEKNLILKAAYLLQSKFNINKGAKIHLDKRIPFPGGLGGGSSNAAITIIGLTKFWGLNIEFEDLVEIGSKIGSDVPFFFIGGTVIGTGRGTDLKQTSDIVEKHMLIVTPDIEISTAEAYSKLDAQDLTKNNPKSILKICRDEATKLESGHLNFTNDFEKSVFKIKPEIKQIKDNLLDLKAVNVLLSGSGASVFAIFDNEDDRQFALNEFKKNYSRTFAVETISRLEYIKFLEPCNLLLPKSF